MRVRQILLCKVIYGLWQCFIRPVSVSLPVWMDSFLHHPSHCYGVSIGVSGPSTQDPLTDLLSSDTNRIRYRKHSCCRRSEEPGGCMRSRPGKVPAARGDRPATPASTASRTTGLLNALPTAAPAPKPSIPRPPETPAWTQFTSPVVAFWMTTSAPKLIKPAPKTCQPGTNISAAPPIIAAPPTMYSQLSLTQSPAAASAPRLAAPYAFKSSSVSGRRPVGSEAFKGLLPA